MIPKTKHKPIFPTLELHKEFIESLPESSTEVIYVLKEDGVIELLENFSTDPNVVLFDPTGIKSSSIILHTHNGTGSATLTDRDIQTSYEVDVPVASWHTGHKRLDYFDPYFPHPYPLDIKSDILGWYDFLNLMPSQFRCNCYTLAADIACAIFGLNYPRLNFFNTDYIAAFKNPASFGFEQVRTEPEPGDVAILFLSMDVPCHMVQIIDTQNNSPLGIHIVGGKYRSELIKLNSWKRNIVSYWRFKATTQA